MRLFPLAISIGLVTAAVPVAGQQNREVPYWASLRAAEVNMRVGPSEAFPISWVYKRPGLPIKVVRINQGWRLVEDPDGARGWVVARLLKPERTALVQGKEPAVMRSAGNGGGEVAFQAEPGVVGKLGDCDDAWCKFSVGDRKGWIERKRVWGDGDP